MSDKKFKTRFNTGSHTGLFFVEPSCTSQSYAEDVNIHNIFKRGMNAIPSNSRKPIYGVDLCSVPDYQKSLQIVADAKNQFAIMPPELREKFHNNPEEFLAFVSDKDKNYDEGLKLGIFTEAEKPNVFERMDTSLTTIAQNLSTQPQTAGISGSPVNNSFMSTN